MTRGGDDDLIQEDEDTERAEIMNEMRYRHNKLKRLNEELEECQEVLDGAAGHVPNKGKHGGSGMFQKV